MTIKRVYRMDVKTVTYGCYTVEAKNKKEAEALIRSGEGHYGAGVSEEEFTSVVKAV